MFLYVQNVMLELDSVIIYAILLQHRVSRLLDPPPSGYDTVKLPYVYVVQLMHWITLAQIGSMMT